MAVDFVQATNVAPVHEQPVFAARSSRRPRALRLGGRAAAILTGLWVAGLLVGAFGFGYLPGIKLPSAHKSSIRPAPAPETAAHGHARAAVAADALRDARRPQAPAVSGEVVRSHGQAVPGSRQAPTHVATPGRGSAGSLGGSAQGTGPAAPGTRSQSLSAPGRTHSSVTPTPGTGSRSGGRNIEGTTNAHASASSKTAH